MSWDQLDHNVIDMILRHRCIMMAEDALIRMLTTDEYLPFNPNANLSNVLTIYHCLQRVNFYDKNAYMEQAIRFLSNTYL
jgi:hypothetical protein